MILHKQMKRPVSLFIVLCIGLLTVAIILWLNQNQVLTGKAVPVASHPYHQLAYTKLAYQGGNFTGDVYLLDVDSGETTQLTQGGGTGTVLWLDSANLIFYERPQGSVVNHYLLDVNRGTSQETHPVNPEIFTTQQSPDAQRLVTTLTNPATGAVEGYTVIDVAAERSQTRLNLWDLQSIPVWLPDSETIVYAMNRGEVCLHHVITTTRDCISGTQPLLSPAITPVMLAYTTVVNDLHQLCIATIEDRNFSHISCHDSNEAQFTGLAWRP